MKQARALITIVASFSNDKYRPTNGERVLLKKEPNNPNDADAIAVFSEDGMSSVGYLANKSNTVQADCQSATTMQSMFNSTAWAKVTKAINIQTSSGREIKGYIAEVVEIDKEAEETNMNKEYSFKLVGSKTLYPNKFVLADELKKGIQPMVRLVNEGDKIVAYYQDGLCGYIESRKQEGVYSYDELKDIIVEEKVAKITSQVTTNYIGVITIGEAEVVKNLSAKSMTDVLERLISEGLATKDELDARVEYMKKFGVTEKQMATLLGTFKAYPPEVAKRIQRPKTLYQDSSGILKRSIGYMNVGRNLLFEGDRGVGKNVLTETLAWLYKRPLYELSLNSQHDNNSLLGSKTIVSETTEEGKERTQVGFDTEVAVEAAEYGGILNMDEFNTSFGHVMSVFNSLLDDRRRIQVPGYKTIFADANFVVVATQNKDYQGTFENNEATIDRFVPIEFPPLKSIEDVLMAKVPGIPFKVVEDCQKLFAGIKKAVEDGEISERAISIRGFIDACSAIGQDIPLKEALVDNIANRAQDRDERKSIRNMIEDIVL